MTVESTSLFRPEIQERMAKIVSLYEQKRAALLPLLNLAQEELGYVPPEVEQFVSEYLEVPIVHVREVVSFYTLLRSTPPPKCRIEMCTNLSCVLRGADRLYRYAQGKLGLPENGSTADGRFGLESVECLGACEFAPVAQVNGSPYVGNLTEEKLDRILAAGGTQAQDWCADLPEAKAEGAAKQSPEAKAEGELLISKKIARSDACSLKDYQREGGYRTAKAVLSGIPPDDVVETVKNSNLRGLGGAGFTAGMKWTFVPRDATKPKYLVVNADESEPGTFKDKYILVRAPHLLIEGMLIASYAIGIHKAYIYIRKEYEFPYRRLQEAVNEAYREGYLGKNIFGTGFDLDVVIHRGAGAYICGEESALLESLEGKKGFPRLRPPFPAVVGLFGCPTVINNVETLSYLPYILERGAPWFAGLGYGKNGGMKLFCLSGHVARPGVYELPMGTPLRELIFEHAGGVWGSHKLKAVIPGGISANILTADEIDVRMDFDSLKAAGTMLGSAGVMVLDETVCIVKALFYASKFFAHESCGQCSPCREGTGWVHKIVKRILEGRGRPRDIDNMLDIAAYMTGTTICAFGDAAAMPVTSYIKKFRGEFEYHIEHKRCNL
jgi:NADH-quinone oxidoreductase subunit F